MTPQDGLDGYKPSTRRRRPRDSTALVGASALLDGKHECMILGRVRGYYKIIESGHNVPSFVRASRLTITYMPVVP